MGKGTVPLGKEAGPRQEDAMERGGVQAERVGSGAGPPLKEWSLNTWKGRMGLERQQQGRP